MGGKLISWREERRIRRNVTNKLGGGTRSSRHPLVTKQFDTPPDQGLFLGGFVVLGHFRPVDDVPKRL